MKSSRQPQENCVLSSSEVQLPNIPSKFTSSVLDKAKLSKSSISTIIASNLRVRENKQLQSERNKFGERCILIILRANTNIRDELMREICLRTKSIRKCI